jgi:hypothetical protein
VLGDGLAVGVLALADGVQDVALRDDAGTGLLRVDHYRGADPAAGHRASGLAQGVAGIDREDHVAHSGTDLHATSWGK